MNIPLDIEKISKVEKPKIVNFYVQDILKPIKVCKKDSTMFFRFPSLNRMHHLHFLNNVKFNREPLTMI